MQLPFDSLALSHLLIPSRGLQTWLGCREEGQSASALLILFGNGELSNNSLTLSVQIQQFACLVPRFFPLTVWSRCFLRVCPLFLS